MQINLPEEIDSLIRERAAAAGFTDQISAYIAHLVRADETEDYGAPAKLSLDQKSRDDLNAKIEAGFESGAATPMSDGDWQDLHRRIDSRQSNS